MGGGREFRLRKWASDMQKHKQTDRWTRKYFPIVHTVETPLENVELLGGNETKQNKQKRRETDLLEKWDHEAEPRQQRLPQPVQLQQRLPCLAPRLLSGGRIGQGRSESADLVQLPDVLAVPFSIYLEFPRRAWGRGAGQEVGLNGEGWGKEGAGVAVKGKERGGGGSH